MLYTKSVDPKLLGSLNELMKFSEFQNFILVGGTALALQIGHRVSVGIDLFGNSEIKEQEFIDILKNLGKVIVLKKSANILICSVDGIKVDFVNYKYPWLQPPIVENEIRLASQADIAAIKLNGIAGRGSKKDFIDVFYLLNCYSMDEMISFYLNKYEDGSEFMVRKSLAFFGDAEKEASPELFENISWSDVKSKILEST